MLGRLLLLFTVVPAVELYLLIQVGRSIGVLETIWLIVVTRVIGASMARREGMGVLASIQAAATQGRAPTKELAEGGLILVGGLMLLTPGILTDLWGLLCILPWSRRWLAPRMATWLGARVDESESIHVGTPRPGPAVEEMEDRFDHPVG